MAVLRCFDLDFMPQSRAREFVADPETLTGQHRYSPCTCSTRKVNKCQHNATPPIPGLCQMLSTY
jgi:hypothetical protein